MISINDYGSYSTQDKNINSTNEEELLIKSLIEDIYNAEKKISEINSNENGISEGIFNLNNKKLSELKLTEDIFNKKINDLNNEYQTVFVNKKNEILIQKNKINNLDIILNEYRNKIRNINISDISVPVIKYHIENNKVLSKQQINDIYNDKKNEKENNKLKEIKQNLEINKVTEAVILNNQNEYKKNLERIDENIKMLKEEKLLIKDELFDIISYKETLESINKNNLNDLKNMIKNIKINDNNEPNEIIKIYKYELMILDFNKISIQLYEELSSNLGFNLVEFSKKNKTYYSKSQSKEYKTIEIYDKKKISIKQKEIYNNNNDINNNKNKSLNASFINSYNNNIKIISEKNSFELLIDEELNSFINEEEYNNSEINDLLNNIALIIINHLKKIEIKIPLNFNDKVILYLSYFFKILFYDKVINNKIKFVNKDYKNIKKEYQKGKEFINNEILKLDGKYEETKEKKIELENKLKIIKESNTKSKFNEIDMTFVNLNEKINEIMEEKDDIKNNIINYENDINNKKIEINNEIENINNELRKVKEEINQINNENELNKIKNNESIINYRKIIAEKFNIIKEQLQLYKKKYGSNISLYNKFISKINNSLQKNRNKIFIGLEKKIINNNEYQDLNSLFNNNNNDSNNLTNILNKTANNLRKKQTMDDYNLSSNDLILNYSNKNYNFINSIKIEKTNKSFNKNLLSNSTKKKLFPKKKPNSRLKNNINFEIWNKNEFNLNNFIPKKEENSKTFNHSFFRKQNKSQGDSDSTKRHLQSKGDINTLNINLYRNKKFSINNKGIPKGNKLSNKKEFNMNKKHGSLKNIIKNNNYNIDNKDNMINNDFQKNIINKLIPLTKITFCYFREIKSYNNIKYNPLLNLSSKELCEYPYNFIKSTITLSKNYKQIKIMPSTQLEPYDIDILSISNTVVSSGIKTIIDIYRNYFKLKSNNNMINVDEFINEQIIKYNNSLTKEEIEKSINNKNFNFSMILNEDNNNKRFELIICSYDEFKMWINGMAFIIKNKNQIINL